ncbi:MAG: hypothetical protein K8W52_05585 [Deltaproteobacteria bacterium]|nr:hypothetical protein [Deltaproteobacteria bacterium]
MATSRYDLFRKRLAPVALIVALAALAHETCSHRSTNDVTIELGFGNHAGEIRHLRADVFVDGEPDAWMEQDFGPDGADRPPRFRAMVPGDHAVLRVDMVTTAGPRRVEHKLAPESGATLLVDLGADLDSPPR